MNGLDDRWQYVLPLALAVWHYNPLHVSGINVPFMPLEEFLFFLVIPLCGLLTYTAVSGGPASLRGRRVRWATRSRR